jgi:hypothetical protein
MANISRTGFWPVDTLTSSHEVHVRRQEVASSNATAIFVGDALISVAGGTVLPTTAGGGVYGVAQGVSYVTGGKRISAKYVPITTTYSPTARGSENATYCFFYDDPGTTFEGQFATALTSSAYQYIHNNVDIVATAGSVTTGISGHTLNHVGVTTATMDFRIIQLADIRPDEDVTAANQHAWVQMNRATAGANPFLTVTGV